MSLILHGFLSSPGVRSTLLTLKFLNLKTDFRHVNVLEKQHLTSEFLNLNPLHTVPVLQDGNFVLCESHAINCYLAGKYGKDDSLYPKNLEKRALVDKTMYLNCGALFPPLRRAFLNLLDGKPVSDDQKEEIEEGYISLETVLGNNPYVAGDNLTLADFSIVTTITSSDKVIPIRDRYPKISEWIEEMQKLPCYRAGNQIGLDKFTGYANALMKKIVVKRDLYESSKILTK